MVEWFRVGNGKSHAVDRLKGDQGRSGQVVAWCGYGTIVPTWEDKPSNPCKTCLSNQKISHASGCNGKMITKWSGKSCRCGSLWECY